MITPPRILIVEDDAILAVNLQMTLVQIGYQVVGLAATGQAAVEFAMGQKPDVILMDIHLRGEMNGIQAARQIHEQLDTPIVYLTAFTDENLFQQVKTTDAYAYLTKPFRERDLRASLEMALYKHAAEQRLQSLNQVLRALRDINQLITRERDPQRLMDKACQILVPTRGYRYVWIGTLSGDTLKPLASAGEEGDWLVAHIIARATPEQAGRLPGVQAARTLQPVVVPDMQAGECFAPWREEIRKAGFYSTVAVPILYQDCLFGILNVYAELPNRFDGEEVDLLCELAGDIAFGLKTIAEENERKQVEEALRESQSTLKAIIDSTSDMIWSVDLESYGLLTFNQSLSNYFLNHRQIHIQKGMGPEDLFQSQEFIDTWRAFYQRVLEEGPYTIEYSVFSGATTLLLSFNLLQRDGQNFGISVFGKDVTERNRAQEQLQILKFTIDTAPDSAYWMDMDGHFIYVNDSACKALGYTRAELLQMSIEKISPSATPLRWVQVIQDLKEKKNIAMESVHRRKDGSEFPVEINSTYIQFGDQEYVNGFARDITERKLAQEKIAQSEKNYRELFEANKDGIAIFHMSPQGIPQKFVELNPAAHNMLGYSREEMLRFTPMMLEREVTPLTSEYRQRQLETHGMVSFETTLVHKDGHRVFAEFTAQVIQYEGRMAIMNIIHDITERKQAEETLRESEEKYRALVENSVQGVILYQGTDLAYVNPRLCEISGYNAEELKLILPTHSPDVIHPDDRARIAERNDQYLSGKFIDSKDAYRLIRKDGDIRHVETSSRTLTLEGKPSAIVTMIDVTERNQRENELQAIATLSAVLRTAPTRAEMLPVIVAQLIDLLKIDSASIEIIDPQTGDAVVEAGQGAWKELVGTRQKQNTGLNALISQTRRPFISHDLENDASPFFHKWARKGIRGSAGVPLIAQEKLIGYIWIGRKTDIASPEMRLLSAIADITANAIQRATSHEQALAAAASLTAAYDTTLEGWARALELRDQETEGHTRRVVDMTVMLAKALGIEGVELENTRRGALLHDIGKMGIPDSVLLKPGTLNEREWEIMRRHTEYARDLLLPIDYLRNTIDIPFNHHEKWDGTGYPRGLKGEEIPLAARLFAVADVWDALTSDRPYRKAWSKEQTLKFIREQKGQHFDPRVVDLFLEVINRESQ